MSSQEESKPVFVEGGKNLKGGGFTRNEMMTLDKVKNFRIRNYNTGIYLSAYLYDQENVKEANLYADFYLDYDSEEDFEKAREDAIMSIRYMKHQFTYGIPESLIRIYFSGKKGLHLIVPAKIMGITPDKHLNEYYKLMAARIGEESINDTVDLKIYDRRRLFRMVNSKHADTGLFKIPLTYAELLTLPVEEIKKLAQMPRKVKYNPAYEITRAKSEFEKYKVQWEMRFKKKFDSKNNSNSKPLDFTPACIGELIESGPQKGQRNNTASALTSFWRKQGLSEQETWEQLVKWNNGSMSEGELKNTMQSVWKNNYEYGCSTLETLATCIGGDCPLFRGRTR